MVPLCVVFMGATEVHTGGEIKSIFVHQPYR